MIDPMDTDSIIEKLACEQVEKILSNGIILRQQARIKVLEAKLKIIAMDSIAEDLSIEMSADRIEELEAENAELKAKLAKAVNLALEECPFREGTGSYNDWWYDRRTTIAELTGGKDG